MPTFPSSESAKPRAFARAAAALQRYFFSLSPQTPPVIPQYRVVNLPRQKIIAIRVQQTDAPEPVQLQPIINTAIRRPGLAARWKGLHRVQFH